MKNFQKLERKIEFKSEEEIETNFVKAPIKTRYWSDSFAEKTFMVFDCGQFFAIKIINFNNWLVAGSLILLFKSFNSNF